MVVSGQQFDHYQEHLLKLSYKGFTGSYNMQKVYALGKNEDKQTI